MDEFFSSMFTPIMFTVPSSSNHTKHILTFDDNKFLFGFIYKAIAKGLSDSGETKVLGKSLPIHEFLTKKPFPKAPKASRILHKITSVAGHVFNVDFPSEYQSW